MSLLNKCISNKTNHPRIVVGQNYELFEHEDKGWVWVKVLDESNSVGYITIQAPISDFKSIQSWRNHVIDKLI